MRVTSHAGGEERRVLIGMITDDTVAGKVTERWTREGLFKSRWANLIGLWCCKHYRKYGKAPLASIESIYQSWAAGGNRDEKTVSMVGKFLSGLSDEYEELAASQNAGYLVDLAGRHFQSVALARLSEEIKAELELGEVDRAEQARADFRKVELGDGCGIDVFEDDAAIREVFEEENESLIEWPDNLATFFGNAFERDAFLSFLAPEKRGKTMWLLDVGWRAMLQKRRVAFFEVGDMSQKQIMRRLLVRASRHPLVARTVRKPVKMEKDDEGVVTVDHTEVEFDEPLSLSRALRARDKVIKGRKIPYLKLSCHPNSSISVDGIRSILRGWEQDEWVPDIVVIDYADNLEASMVAGDYRHSVNVIWKQLRRLSQELHCCLVTATQADAASYDRATIGKTNFSEDKRKLSHVTGMIGLNQTRDEYDRGIMRLNWIVRRDDEFNEYRCLHLATCFELSRPFVLSCF